jgi:hypothetical protein
MKKGDKVKIKKGHGDYNKLKGKIIKKILMDGKNTVLIQGEGISGAVDLATKKPIPNARYIYEDDVEVQ